MIITERDGFIIIHREEPLFVDMLVGGPDASYLDQLSRGTYVEPEVCPKCNGVGYVAVKIAVLPAIVTFGLTALFDLLNRKPCKVCSGNGYLNKTSE